MSAWTVRRRATDSSGRGVFASDFMWAWWLRCCDELGFTPTIVQGAWMTLAGGGANQSAGYHDGGGCFDLRIRDRSSTERGRMIHVFRSMGAAYWERYESQGFDLHAHLCLGSDADIDDGAFQQWREYLAGGDGLTGSAPDYHWRPDPIITTPPPEDFMASSETEHKLDRIILQGAASKARDIAARKIARGTLEAVEALARGSKDPAILSRITRAKSQVLAAIREAEAADEVDA